MSETAKTTRPGGTPPEGQGIDYPALALNLVGLVAGVAIWWALTAG
ncbi:MAG: ABC transporter permease, partial [Mesorhizobium sp.]